jgi:hypothetical protein
LAANLVGKIVSSIGNPLMYQLYNLECFLSLWCAFWSFG